MGKQPTMGQKKTKEAIAKAAAASKKGGKKKWSKGKVKDKLDNKVFIDDALWATIQKEVPNMSLVTVANLSEKYKMIGSIARQVIKILVDEAKLEPVGHQHKTLSMHVGKNFLEKKKAATLKE